MFTEYFTKQATTLEKALKSNLQQRGVQLPAREKDINVFQEFYDFLNEHIPGGYTLATGKVRNKKHLLNRNCDLLIYKKWCQRYLELTGGYVLSDSLYAFMSLEADLNAANLQTHANLTRAMKSLYMGDPDTEEQNIIPLYSVMFAYDTSSDMPALRESLQNFSREKEIPVNQEIDLICVLNKGLMIKDWESAGGYKIVETGNDTLMWFYILLIEYLDRDGEFELNLRDYIKNTREYNEA
ncbi:MAG: hypothetical protein KDK27_12800 [Leptospiraceae bacterium]|nr:hypothetical protein [Leptospiraceae bacterium]